VSDKKIIAVVGATGAQGGGLVRAILAEPDGPFAVRALTRDTTSAKACSLADSGVDVVSVDVDDKASVRRALEGAYGAYLMTSYWEYFSAEREQAQARAMAAAARGAGVRHAIWSTLPDTRREIPVGTGRMPVLAGRYNVPHFDSKGEADRYFAEAAVPTTFLSTTFYFENFITQLPPARDENGKLFISLPMADSKLAGIAAEDIGRTAHGIFKRGEELVGRTIEIAGESLTGHEYAAQFSAMFAEEVEYRPMPLQAYRALGFPGVDDAANMFQYYVECSAAFTGARDVDHVRTLNPRLQDFATWLDLNRSAFEGLR